MNCFYGKSQLRFRDQLFVCFSCGFILHPIYSYTTGHVKIKSNQSVHGYLIRTVKFAGTRPSKDPANENAPYKPKATYTKKRSATKRSSDSIHESGDKTDADVLSQNKSRGTFGSLKPLCRLSSTFCFKVHDKAVQFAC